MHIRVILTPNEQILYVINIIMCYFHKSFRSFQFTGWSQTLYFYSICWWSPNGTCDKIFSENYEVQHVLDVPEEFSRYSTKRLTSKIFIVFCPYSVFNTPKVTTLRVAQKAAMYLWDTSHKIDLFVKNIDEILNI